MEVMAPPAAVDNINSKLANEQNINAKLANELLTMICQFLPFHDLKNAMLVCRFAQK